MKKVFKKLTAVALSVMLVYSSVTTVSAEVACVDDEAILHNFNGEVANLLSIHYNEMLTAESGYACAGEVPCYVYGNGEFERVDTIKFYPVYRNNDIIGTVRETIYNGSSYFSYSEEFSEEIEQFTKDNNKYNLIFVDDTLYLNSSDDILLIDIYSVEANEQSRTVYVNNEQLDSLFENTKELEFAFVNNVKTEIVTTESSQVSSYSFALPFSSQNYINYSFDLPSYNQGSYGICWACCIWSIGEFINSATTYNNPWGLIDEIHEDETLGMTEEEKNDHYQNMYLAGRTINQSKTYLQTYYGISTTKHTSVLQFPHAVSFLSQNKPIFMDMPNNDNGGHNMVMCGYGSSSNSYYIRTLDSKNAVYRTMQLVNGTCTIQYSATSGPYTWQRSLTIN